ncbi:MAG TPA: biotin transporter BioY [Candidatus Mediterraneibacter merdipullorum]|nr:biotin transporter BioY [Candidatus Mediterraneibacter merdipullorum]
MKTAEKKYRTADLVYIALGAVLITICSWISIPAAVPFTMQTFAVFFVLSAMGGKRGTASVIVYVLLGAFGVPVFSQFNSGPGALLGNTGGYIIGFIFTGLVYQLITGVFGKKRRTEVLALLAGLAALYAFGTAWFLAVYTRTQGGIGLTAVLASCVVPFLIPDVVKLFLALSLSRRVGPLTGRAEL